MRPASLKKAPRARKPPPTDVELFLKAVVEAYPNDPIRPGLVVSYLPERRCFYASVVRYEGNREFHRKVVVAKATGRTTLEAVDRAAARWRTRLLEPQESNLQEFLSWGGYMGKEKLPPLKDLSEEELGFFEDRF